MTKRIAMVCPACEKAGRPRRNFSDPDWKCPEHNQAVVQPNHPYFGRAT